jgi:AcrR family transcriptional regulator
METLYTVNTMASQPDLDAHVRRLWRHRGLRLPMPRRGPPQQLNLDEILQAGIAIADAEGLAAVSTRAIAARFGKSAMALYSYVGTKEHLLALMQDHATAMPAWADPKSSLAEALRAWALALFELYLVHPWLAERPWSQATQGPNERDWLERLLQIMQRWAVAEDARTPAVTMLYATVRATGETAASYRRIDEHEADAWRRHAASTMLQIPDVGERYPLSTRLEPVTPHWRDSPRTGLIRAVDLLADALSRAALLSRSTRRR